ncbi:ATP-dependent DNA helicase [Salinibacterium sp. G-O1]|uniref:ATP-dependent helicase n=1 Tax=Salinibacterium sp. G-O1 TaxID=3046208 RepID=UPI0024B8B017|nr:ATP-dependent DNA helicase [Salinibacterium sp. G-O1]MDJ0334512.1 ATP-dependent DNA helicase [Salinibacterium sp. G-O1]
MANFERDGVNDRLRSISPDPSQRAVIDLPDDACAAVIGAPGSGKTSTMIELVADRVLTRGWSPGEIVILSPSRASATLLRDRLAQRLGVPTPGPMARTANSLAFEVVRDAAALAGGPAPTLLTGAEQDQIIAELLAGEIEDGTDTAWPAHLDAEVRRLRGFRTELRDLMMRAVEYGVSPAALASLGRAHGRDEWVAASHFITVYDQVKASYRGGHFDSTELIREAAAIIREGAPLTIDGLRLVIVDDAQESTESTVTLLRALVGRGVSVIAFGDPDVTTGGFRGAQPDLLGRLGAALGRPVVSLYLSDVHRHGEQVRDVVAGITGRIGAAAAGAQRQATAGAATGAVAAFRLGSPAEEVAFIARRLRERHLLDGVAWSEMAVVVRSGSLVPSLARELRALEVTTSVSSARAAVRDEYAVEGLILLLELSLGIAGMSSGRVLDSAAALDLLGGAVGRLDAVSLRRLKAALRHEELAGGGDRGADDLVVEALQHPVGLVTVDTRVGRAAQAVATNLHATAAAALAGESIEELLWGAWQRTGLAKTWFDQALGSGIVAEEANRHLDAVVALFSAAKRFVERTPDVPAAVFLDSWRSADVAEDTLAARAILDSVTVGTPSAVVGREFDVVVVAGMQENVWPNMRIRGSLLGSQDLPIVVAGGDPTTLDKRLDVMHDELRMFAQAVSRARTEVVVTAVAGDDNLPSPFLRLVPEGTVVGLPRHPLSLRGMVGRMRRELTSTGSAEAASGIARLAAEGVPGAHPSQWYGLAEPSSTAPLVNLDDPDVTVRVSPSRMEAFESCGLHWLIDEVGGGSSSVAANLGTLIHSVAETATDISPEALFAAVQERWGELSFEASWHSEVEKARARNLTTRLSAYLRDFDAAGGSVVNREGSFELQVGRATLRGKIDRVEAYPDGTAVIVDLKTGKNDPTSDDAVLEHAQLGAYQLAFASGAIESVPEGLTNGGAKLVIVSKGARGADYAAPHQKAFTAEQLEAFRGRVIDDSVGMAGAVFVAQLGSHCLDPWSYGRCKIHVVQAVSS